MSSRIPASLGFLAPFLLAFKESLTSASTSDRQEVLEFLAEGYKDREPQGPTTPPPAKDDRDTNGNDLYGFNFHMDSMAEALKVTVPTLPDADDTSDEAQDLLTSISDEAHNLVVQDRWFIYNHLWLDVLKFTSFTVSDYQNALDSNDIDFEDASIKNVVRIVLVTTVLRRAYGEENLGRFTF